MIWSLCVVVIVHLVTVIHFIISLNTHALTSSLGRIFVSNVFRHIVQHRISLKREKISSVQLTFSANEIDLLTEIYLLFPVIRVCIPQLTAQSLIQTTVFLGFYLYFFVFLLSHSRNKLKAPWVTYLTTGCYCSSISISHFHTQNPRPSSPFHKFDFTRCK